MKIIAWKGPSMKIINWKGTFNPAILCHHDNEAVADRYNLETWLALRKSLQSNSSTVDGGEGGTRGTAHDTSSKGRKGRRRERERGEVGIFGAPPSPLFSFRRRILLSQHNKRKINARRTKCRTQQSFFGGVIYSASANCKLAFILIRQ